MHHPHELIIYSRENVFKLNDIPHQCLLKTESSDNNKIRNTPTFLEHIVTRIMQYISLTGALNPSTYQLFKGTVIYCCDKKQSKTPQSSSNAQTRATYTGVLDKNLIRKCYRSIGYPIEPPSKVYKENQVTTKRV